MRTFIEDKKLLAFLDAIEKELESTVSASPLTPQENEVLHCGVQRLPDGWVFKFDPKIKPAQSDLCHEMLHIALAIEGWPDIMAPPLVWNYPDVSMALSVLVPLPQHVIVWPAQEGMGYSSRKEIEEEVTRDLLPALRSGFSLPRCSAFATQSIAALFLAQALLSPIEDALKATVRQVAEQYLPQHLKQACSICTVFEKHHPLSARSSADALEEIFSMIRMPKEILQFSFPERFSPGFLDTLIQKLDTLQ